MHLDSLIASVRDVREPIKMRIRHVHSLETASDPDRLAVLFDLATDHDLPDDVATEVGKSIARVIILAGRLNDVPLANFSGPAYFGYDDSIATNQTSPDLE